MNYVLNNCCYNVGDVAFTQAISYYYYESKRLLCNQGAYIKYVGERVGEFNKFFKKIFVAHDTIELNFSWPGNFCGNYFMGPPISFSFLFKAYLQQYFLVVLTVIYKFQITKEVNIRNNIQKIIFKKNYSNKFFKKPLTYFFHIKILLQQ